MRLFRRRCKICGRKEEKDEFWYNFIKCDACGKWICNKCLAYWFEDADICVKCYGEMGRRELDDKFGN